MRIPDSEQLVRLRRNVLKWFSINGRRLPWRLSSEDYATLAPDQKTKLAYRVWVSEIMLQQTTTTTVCGYFDHFMTEYPTVDQLASADISEVLKLWEGLGYYRRAHQLHKAAQKIVSDFHGVFPNSADSVSSLPGVGKYTAGAILSIAYDLREPILEANTIRLHSRLIGLETNPLKSEGNKILWDFAQTILPLKKSGIFNQALMDLGSTICTVKEPDCRHCPCVSFCEAARTGSQNFLPVLEKKPEKEARLEVAALVLQPNFVFRKQRVGERQLISNSEILKTTDKFLLIRYPEGGRWTGLWDFPRFLQNSESNPQNDDEIQKEFQKIVKYNLDAPIAALPLLGNVLRKIHHSVTKYKITLLFCDSNWRDISLSDDKKTGNNGVNYVNNTDNNSSYNIDGDHIRIHLASGDFILSNIQSCWVTLAQAKEIPLSSTGRKLIDYLENITKKN